MHHPVWMGRNEEGMHMIGRRVTDAVEGDGYAGEREDKEGGVSAAAGMRGGGADMGYGHKRLSTPSGVAEEHYSVGEKRRFRTEKILWRRLLRSTSRFRAWSIPWSEEIFGYSMHFSGYRPSTVENSPEHIPGELLESFIDKGSVRNARTDQESGFPDHILLRPAIAAAGKGARSLLHHLRRRPEQVWSRVIRRKPNRVFARAEGGPRLKAYGVPDDRF